MKVWLKKTLKRSLMTAGVALAVLVVLLLAVVWTGLGDRWARRAIVGQLEKMTGGRVELERFHFETFRVRAELDNLTIHGREPAGTPPLFHADALRMDIRIESFLHRRISLNELELDRPTVHLRVEADGSNNVPLPKTRAALSPPLQQRLFDLVIRRLRIRDADLRFNSVRVPLAAEGGKFELALDYHAGAGPGTPEKPFYLGQMSWQHMVVAARRYLPFASDLAVKFTFGRDSLAIQQLQWKLPHSNLDAEGQLLSFARPDWSFRYRGRLNLEDIREILRKPHTPDGVVEFSGEGTYAGQKLLARGRYAARDIAMHYPWFHSGGITSRGSYTADNRGIEVADFEAQALGGGVTGRVTLAFHGLEFRAETHARGLSLAAILAAVDHASFPVAPLHWNASVDANAVTMWEADFKHLDSRGRALWEPPAELRPGEIPATARLLYHFSMDQKAVEVPPSEISTPSSHVNFSGMLGMEDSALDVTFDTQDLVPWDDFINRLRGTDAEPKRIAGSAHWQGRISGPLAGPTFTGHVRALQAAYGRLTWDEIEGDITYSPDEFRLARGRARRGKSSAQLEVALDLDNWRFAPASQWTLEANFDRASTDGLEELLGWSYPVQGLLSGTFRGRGTHAAPELSGLFDLTDVEAWGTHIDRVRGQFTLSHDEVRISNAELRLPTTLPPAHGPNIAPRPAPSLTGNFLYRMQDQQIAFDLTGAVIPLEGIERLRSGRLPLGGQLSFQLHGKGTLLAPEGEGTLRVVDLRVGKEVLGSFDGRLNSDGQKVHLDVNSAMSTGRLQGRVDLALTGDYPLDGELTIEKMDLDPFIQTALHLTALTGHSSVDGHFALAGWLRRPETLAVDVNISRLSFDYEYVKLENVGPLRLRYSRDEVRIEQATLRGADTDLRISGSARFTGDRRVDLNLAGTLNLRLAGGFIPQLEASGPAQVNARIEGTLSSPRITGKVHVENAGAHYGDFPAGLSQVNGDFVFDSSRLLFENVTAETGGGQLRVSGSLTYGDGPLRYDLTARTRRVRIRYPEGMSWLVGGTLRLSGTTESGLLSGRVVVERLLMAPGFDLATLIVASKEPVRAPTTTSPFLRNLQFDIEGVSSPNARMEWAGAQVETEASLRVRGTWEHPILLGHIHLLAGEMTFRGGRYKLSRGDINFSNPFRLDPVLSVEATTTIRQYEVTLNFTGPASRLTLAYRSDPPLPSGDIITLLALGRTSEESQLRGAGASQTPESGAGALLSEAISSQLGGRLERLFGISRFQVDPFLAGTGTEQNAPARITIEQQVTRDLVITYITNVTSTQQQVIQVEYAIRRDVSIVALRDYNGTFGLDVKFKKRFK